MVRTITAFNDVKHKIMNGLASNKDMKILGEYFFSFAAERPFTSLTVIEETQETGFWTAPRIC